MSGQYEVEIKCLLGSLAAAEQLKRKLKEIDPSCALTATSDQLNHYFEGGDASALATRLAPRLSPEAAESMKRMAGEGTSISVRTRGANGEARIVMKASIGDDSSENGVMRLELDEPVPGMTLEELDGEVLAAGYRYQAKWSRQREEYAVAGTAVCLDRNAGYGYVAEFEKVAASPEEAAAVRKELLGLMEQTGAKELPQARLERMFAYYNEHWPDYYGTDKIFTID